MKVAFIALFFVASVFAQNPSAVATAACGPEKVSINVKLDKSDHGLAQPDPGKALVYIIQDRGKYPAGYVGTVVTMIGLDGKWVGANKNNSYFSISVEPGEHHMCACVQSRLGHPVGLVHFTAEAGNVYYFDARVVASDYGLYLFLGVVDSDQAKFQIASYPLSVSTPKK
jgi:hypothetical protein